MPIFMDRHDMKGTTSEEIAEAHLKDLEIQDKYGVKYLTYWFDHERGTTFCLVDAPDKEAAERVHREAHGAVAHEMIEVDLSAVEAFLGRIHDPASDPSSGRLRPTPGLSTTTFRPLPFYHSPTRTPASSTLGADGGHTSSPSRNPPGWSWRQIPIPGPSDLSPSELARTAWTM